MLNTRGGGEFTEQKQAEIISTACWEANLDGHIKWIESEKQVQTWAERIAIQLKGSKTFPVKNSYMYFDMFDMCFFFDKTGKPVVSCAGCFVLDGLDITEEKLLGAFRRARQVLSTMKELSEEAQE